MVGRKEGGKRGREDSATPSGSLGRETQSLLKITKLVDIITREVYNDRDRLAESSAFTTSGQSRRDPRSA